ncbi:hypothetical protein J7F03_03765 [Streptomyces sp. ISL-43]|uniref:hypothetical protein n=1 Tax=Streptomyces sp. ISL-43 TaxID=2819183 RepID=UPI001BE6C5EE|nr:hypothetical protein [Streptomyces sp. ISL-43]MBT2446218.1 hypothetical protein [Streptomyces sp. ISL-43]
MTAAERPVTGTPNGPGPVSFLAAADALRNIEAAVREAAGAGPGAGPAPIAGPGEGPQHVLASLLLLREVREELAGWESGLIETARAAGASWADLAEPLGVASRQAAERRYLRLRPGVEDGSTGEQRVQAVRDRRAADRSVTAWARENAAALRQLAGQITGLTDLSPSAGGRISELSDALGHHDAARLLDPLSATHKDLHPGHGDLAHRVDAIREHTRRLRDHSDQQRGT